MLPLVRGASASERGGSGPRLLAAHEIGDERSERREGRRGPGTHIKVDKQARRWFRRSGE